MLKTVSGAPCAVPTGSEPPPPPPIPNPGCRSIEVMHVQEQLNSAFQHFKPSELGLRGLGSRATPGPVRPEWPPVRHGVPRDWCRTGPGLGQTFRRKHNRHPWVFPLSRVAASNLCLRTLTVQAGFSFDGFSCDPPFLHSVILSHCVSYCCLPKPSLFPCPPACFLLSFNRAMEFKCKREIFHKTHQRLTLLSAAGRCAVLRCWAAAAGHAAAALPPPLVGRLNPCGARESPASFCAVLSPAPTF